MLKNKLNKHSKKQSMKTKKYKRRKTMKKTRKKFAIIMAVVMCFGMLSVTAFATDNTFTVYFDNSNVGLSFVPITDYYNDQPPTKTYEYCLSGIVCIATATTINKELITPKNGVLIDGTIDGVKKGIEAYWSNRAEYDSKVIRDVLHDCTWDNIVADILNPILKQI